MYMIEMLAGLAAGVGEDGQTGEPIFRAAGRGAFSAS